MGILDKFTKKNNEAEDFELDDEFEDDGEFNEDNDSDDLDSDDDFESDFDIDEDGMSEAKEQGGNLKDMIEKNKKAAIIAGAAASLIVVGVVVEPMITNSISSNAVMNNNEFEQATKQVDSLAKTSVKEESKIRESKKSSSIKYKREQEKKERIEIEKKEKKERLRKERAEKIKKDRMERKKNRDSKKDLSKSTDKNKDSILNSKGHINNKKAENMMNSNFKGITSKIEKTSLNHNIDDEMDPFLQEYDGTVNSRAMRNELTENMKLMKDYIEFLDTKKKFEQAKLVYEKKKQKGLFAEEITAVKADFIKELEGMKKSMADIRLLNVKLANKLVNNKKEKEMSETSKANDELSKRKMKMSSSSTQKVYKIGSSYILEETERDGTSKIYRNGNAYKGSIIVQVTPEFLKVKDHKGDIMIMSINTGSEISGSYATISIPTPAKSDVTNSDMAEGTSVEEFALAKSKEDAKLNDDTNKEIKSRFLN